MVEALAALRAVQIPVALVTNQFGRDCYEGFDLDALADVVVVSSEVGVRKPSRRIYAIACERLGVAPETCVMVDDIQHNLDGAARLGIAGVLHRSAPDTLAQLDARFGLRAAAAARRVSPETVIASLNRPDVTEGVRSSTEQRPPAFPSLPPRSQSKIMDFELTDRCKDYQERVQAFMDEHVYPAEPVYEQQMRESGDPHFHPPIMEELKAEARERGLWNLFHPHDEWGPGPDQRRVRAAGRDHGPQPHLAPEAMNCSAPGHRQHGGARRCSAPTSTRSSGCTPLLEGEIRSAFAMTEPAVASLRRHQHRDCGSSATATSTCSTAASGGRPTRCTRTARC